MEDEQVPGRGTPAGSWNADPFGRHQQRWWDGERWTEKVRSRGVSGIDPPGVDPQAPAPHATARVEPIAPGETVRLTPTHLPRVLLAGVILLLVIVILVIVGLVWT